MRKALFTIDATAAVVGEVSRDGEASQRVPRADQEAADGTPAWRCWTRRS